jgi:hypothetical protein
MLAADVGGRNARLLLARNPNDLDSVNLARPSDSFKPRCANGPTPGHIHTQIGETNVYRSGCITTTGIDPTAESRPNQESLGALNIPRRRLQRMVAINGLRSKGARDVAANAPDRSRPWNESSPQPFGDLDRPRKFQFANWSSAACAMIP